MANLETPEESLRRDSCKSIDEELEYRGTVQIHVWRRKTMTIEALVHYLLELPSVTRKHVFNMF